MKIIQIDFDNIPKDEQYIEMINKLISDNDTLEEYEVYLNSCELLGLYDGETFVGFMSVDRSDFLPEIHAHVLPNMRKHSMSVLKAFLSKWTGPFTTSVLGNSKYVVRYLKTYGGFKDFGMNKDAFLKDGKLYNVYYLYKRI